MPKYMTPKKIEEYKNLSATYDRFFPNGETHIVCPNCCGLVMLFDELAQTQKHEIAQIEGFDKQVALITELTGCDERQAKANIIHMVGPSKKCRMCETKVTKGALLCSNCMSVTLHWEQGE